MPFNGNLANHEKKYNHVRDQLLAGTNSSIIGGRLSAAGCDTRGVITPTGNYLHGHLGGHIPNTLTGDTVFDQTYAVRMHTTHQIRLAAQLVSNSPAGDATFVFTQLHRALPLT